MPPNPAQFRTDHLYLLVGLNPLPNYVAARLLLKPGGCLHLVHSVSTYDTADRLAQVLHNSYGINAGALVAVDESDARDIRTVIEMDLANIAHVESVGLHYTGGTKAMAVHAYAVLEKCGRPVVFSYLDARTMSLKFDSLRADPTQSVSLALWPGMPESKPPDLRALMALHNEALRNAPQQAPVLADAAAELTQKCINQEQAKQWRAWCTEAMKSLRGSFQDGNEGWKPEHTLRDKSLPWPSQDKYPALGWVRPWLTETFQVPENAPRLAIAQAKEGHGLENYRDVCAWIDGLWLEEYVLSCVARVAGDAYIHEFGRGIISRKGGNNPRFNRKFELDVAAMRSYRLFGIACTTAVSKDTSKQKLFEAILRGQQLGGDEVRIGVVSLYSQPNELRRELSSTWQMGDQIQVFGPQHLADLDGRLRQWFTTGM